MNNLTPEEIKKIRDVPVASVRTKYNLRTELTDIPKLMRDIDENGLLQCMYLFPDRDAKSKTQWIVAWGNRRFEAIRQLGWKNLEVNVHIHLLPEEYTEDQWLIRAMSENDPTLRKSLSPSEVGRAYVLLRDHQGLSVEAIAARVHRNKLYVQRHINIFTRIPVEQQPMVGYEHGREYKKTVPLGTADKIVSNFANPEHISKVLSAAFHNALTGEQIDIIVYLVRTQKLSIDTALKIYKYVQVYSVQVPAISWNVERVMQEHKGSKYSFPDLVRRDLWGVENLPKDVFFFGGRDLAILIEKANEEERMVTKDQKMQVKSALMETGGRALFATTMTTEVQRK